MSNDRKELVDWVRGIYQNLNDAEKRDAIRFFPELRESEDERIRKEFVALIKDAEARGDYWHDLKVADILAWLEKQKEQKPCEDSGTDGDIMQYIEEGEKRGIKEVISFPEKYGLQKEQNPEEWRKEDEKILLSLFHAINCADAQNAINKTGVGVADVSSWLFSIKERVCPQSHWKPSEKQMRALYEAWYLCSVGAKTRNLLESLWNDLSKRV